MLVLVSHGVLGFSDGGSLVSGELDRALELALRAAQSRPADATLPLESEARAGSLHSLGRLLLLLGRSDDAADSFAKCAKEIPRSARSALQAHSCLTAALQCLSRNQVRAAWNCLQRTLDVKGVPLTVQVKACAAMAALFFRLGMRRPAAAAATQALALLDPADARHDIPRAVLQVLQVEFVVLDLLRQHPRLVDLAFWPRDDEMAGQRAGPADALMRISECRERVGRMELLTARLDFLASLVRIAYEASPPSESGHAHIERAVRWGIDAYCSAARQELALAFVAANERDHLQRLMQCFYTVDRMRAGQHHNFEIDYCMAKMGELNGREDTYIAHYRHYATQAMVQIRRTCAYITVPTTIRQASAEIPKDDITSRLPARYRRAYQFILRNLQNEDLSIKLVAEELGVTERALQMVFRSHLGQSPSEVIRQCRMERIRDDLASSAGAHGASTLDVAQRWGVRSRSALASGYRKAFGELPSQTRGNPVFPAD